MSYVQSSTVSAARADVATAARDRASRRSTGSRRAVLICAVVAAAALRLAALGRQPLWLDEATDAAFAARSLMNCIFAESVHPPLYRVLLHFAVRALGDSSFALRLLPALFGVLCIPAMALLAEQLFPDAESAAVAFAATSPFLIYYAQENRNYSLFILLAMVSTWALFRFRDTGRGLALYSVLSVMLMYTHYLAVFVLLAHEIVYWTHWRTRPRDWILGRAAVALAFMPWMIWLLRHYQNESRLFLWPGWLVPAALLRFLMGYGVDAADSARNAAGLREKFVEEAPLLAPALALYAWILGKGFRRAWRISEVRTLLAGMLVVPWAVLLLLAPWTRLSHERYLAFQAPFVLLVMAAGFSALRGRARLLAGAGLAAIIAFSLAAYYGAPGSVLGYRFRYAKEDWAGVAAFMRGARVDAVILAPGYLQLPLGRYSLGAAREIPVPYDSSALPGLGDAHRAALVLSHTGDVQEQLRARMDSRCRRISEADFTSQNLIRVIVYDTSALCASRPDPAPR